MKRNTITKRTKGKNVKLILNRSKSACFAAKREYNNVITLSSVLSLYNHAIELIKPPLLKCIKCSVYSCDLVDVKDVLSNCINLITLKR